MCGICGYIRHDKDVLPEEDGQVIRNMTRRLSHRGPDADDFLLFGHVAFGFSRLSIIGLLNGMQPISSEDGSVVVICNGEIFNYIELKAALKQKGHVFKTDSDVEVLVHLYEDAGVGFLHLLNGQFAFALYDKKQQKLFCARDQMGIIPLFYTKVDDTFIFGSEIKAILEHPLVVAEPDLVGLDQVFTFAGLVSPRTLFKNIHSLPNGHFLVVNADGDITCKEYWDLEFPEGEVVMNGKSESWYVNRLEELIDASVALRLRADVPFGFYLSGGLDSSIIAMKIHQLLPGIRKEAFSIDFVDAQISETPYQVMAADKSNANLNRKTFFYEDISKRLQSAIYHCECPLKETYNTASLSLSESVRAKGIKVILSGEGADELFAGYVGYRFDKMRAMQVVQNQADAAEEKLRCKLWGDSTFFYERNFLEFDAIKKKLYAEELAAGFEAINCLNHPVVNVEKVRNRDLVNKRAYIDYKLRLVDHLVSDHGDRMALANGVEVRYPFLDKDLVEFSTRVPTSLKLNDFNEKYILKKMAEPLVPKQIVEREKFGFVAPGSPYLLQNNIEYINDLLSYESIKKQGVFNPGEVEDLKKTYSQPGFTVNAPFESDLLITVITYGILHDTFFKK